MKQIKTYIIAIFSIFLITAFLYSNDAGVGSEDPSNETISEKPYSIPDRNIDLEKLFENPALGHYLSIEEIFKPPLEKDDSLKTPPPTGTISPVAEFEPSEAVLIRYPFGIPFSLIKELAKEIRVITLVRNASQQQQVLSLYANNDINLKNCSFIIQNTDSYWTRDYGPWFIRENETDISVVDFIYNRPRPNDNQVPYNFASSYNMPYYNMNIYHCGGNYMSDGYYIAASSDLVYYENTGMTPSNIDSTMEEYMGISIYHVVPDPNNTYIDHIDCWGKYLAPDKILIRRVPSSHPQYTAIEETVNYFSQQISAYGTRYRIFRVDTPNDQPYTNSLILNNRVFVPLMGHVYYDNLALAAYENAMPGYEIIGSYGSWYSTDALHCRTKEIADREMLHIGHLPVFPIQPEQEEYEINTRIIPYSGTPLLEGSPKLFYRHDDETEYSFVLLNETSDHNYSTSIYSPPGTQKISYFISAQDGSGRHENHPYIGGADPHIFYPVPEDSLIPEYPLHNQTDISITLPALSWYFSHGHIEVTGFQIHISTCENLEENVFTDHIPYTASGTIHYDLINSGISLDKMTDYYWKVNIMTTIFDIDFTPVWHFTTYAYPSPHGLQASLTYSDRIELNWDWSKLDGPSTGLSGFNIYRGQYEQGEFERINEVPITTDNFTDYSVLVPETYYYAVTAVYDDGIESIFSNTALGMTIEEIQPELKDKAVISLESSPHKGIWLWEHDSSDSQSIGLKSPQWTKLLTGTHATNLLCGDINNDGRIEILANLPDYGIWYYSFATNQWTNIIGNSVICNSMVLASINERSYLIASFHSHGIYKYDLPTAGWNRITHANANIMLASNIKNRPDNTEQLLISFSGHSGLYLYDFSEQSFSRPTSALCSGLYSADITGDGFDEVICAFDDHGTFMMNTSQKQNNPKRSNFHFTRITTIVPDPGHSMSIADITEYPGPDLIMTYQGAAYAYSFFNSSWSLLFNTAFNIILSGRFTNSEKDDMILAESATGNIYLWKGSKNSRGLLVPSGHASAMAKYSATN